MEGGNRFCRRCGNAVIPPAHARAAVDVEPAICGVCRTPAPPDGKFCRRCGGALTPATACPECGRQLAPGARCTDCAATTPDGSPRAPRPAPATGGRIATARATPTAVTPVQLTPTLPVLPPAPAEDRKSPPALVGVAVLIALLVAAGGVFAGITVFDGRGSGERETASSDTSADAPRVDDSALLTDAGSASGAADGDAGRDATPLAARPAPAPPPTARPAVVTPSTGNSPTGVMQRYWQAIADGSYVRAFATFTASRQASLSRAAWVRQQRRYAPDVHVIRIALHQQLGPGEALVSVDVVTRDHGTAPKADSAVCRRFAGKVNVVYAGGGWRYRPFGQGATWSDRGSLAPRDKRCSPLF